MTLQLKEFKKDKLINDYKTTDKRLIYITLIKSILRATDPSGKIDIFLKDSEGASFIYTFRGVKSNLTINKPTPEMKQTLKTIKSDWRFNN